MTVSRVEVGLVSTNEALVDFFITVFDLKRLPVITSGAGVLHPLQAPGVTIKVMVPAQPPTVTEPPAVFIGATGIRYLTMYVDDLGKITDRVLAAGGRLVMGPLDVAPGVRLAVFGDPDGNALEVVEGAS
ncbi:VOC family protein [Glutamicibacter sp. V16R2B1]|uniref:VOC family protein n=1 Tax=Glutamicibacter sp. V16R2B1 TaxID=2036207 RepID=UPI0010FF53D6|nr:VOC family protein [Glutamicibacter sp. V16R2B1]MCK9901850.1 VOC family protein [Frankia sp. Cpl3]TLK46234.1 VOC family protein [Glutamicibacter sp. V16R2B1]